MNDLMTPKRFERDSVQDVVMANPRIAYYLRGISRGISVFSVIVGLLFLLAGLLGLGVLTNVSAGRLATSPSSALGILLIGVALWNSRDVEEANGRVLVVRLCAGGAAVIGLLAIAEYAFDRDLWIDHFLVTNPDVSTGVTTIERMAPGAAVAIAILGGALVQRSRGREHWSIQVMALAAGWIAFLAILGHMYGVELLYGVVWALSKGWPMAGRSASRGG